MLPISQNQRQSAHNFSWETSFGIPEAGTTSIQDSTGPQNLDEIDPSSSNRNFPYEGIADHNWDFLLEANQTSSGQLPSNHFDCFSLTPVGTSSSVPFGVDAQDANYENAQDLHSHRASFSSADSTRMKKRRRHDGGVWARRDSQVLDEASPNMTLTPFTALHDATANANRTIMSEGLLRIYHDVLENNLACWITEDTCPYQLERRIQIRTLEQRTQPEWGTAWSNRMYRRVKQLDRVAQETKLVQLTSSQNRAASRALDLVVMAFATQWAQGRRRMAQFDPAAWVGENEESEFDDFGHDFERNLQYSVWQQAKIALQEVFDLECFRVIYAELVFGLIQKPLMPSEDDENCAFEKGMFLGLDRSAILTHITRIMAQEGPPVFLERGTRKIHALKHRLEARQAAHSKQDPKEGSLPEAFGGEHIRTVSLLYWMAIMFDTVSSSMNERPLVVGDDECEHDSQQDTPNKVTKSRILNHKWRLELYAQEDPGKPSSLHWPCPYEDATRAVSRSAAVKVLLFRYVSYLQNALRKKENGQALEEIIEETMVVYRYWNKTHGAFFQDLTSNFDTIPARLKSWFPCISIPWHLGSLMLADLIDEVDENRAGIEQSRQERANATLTSRIRRSSAAELADLAMIVTPQDMSANRSQEQLKDFHFAVSGSSLLTEPWTVLMVRGFTKAAVFHLSEAEEMRKYETSVLGHESREFRLSVKRGKVCVRALWLLGTKSDMAKAISKSLAHLLQLYETDSSVETGCSGSSWPE